MKRFQQLLLVLVTLTAFLGASDCASIVNITLAEIDVCTFLADGVVIRSPTECDASIMCYRGKGQRTQCRDGLHFDKDRVRCLPKKDVECTLSTDVCVGKAAGTLVKDPTNCNGYYFCERSGAVRSVCSAGSQFNAESQRCLGSGSVDCTSEQKSEDELCQWIPSKVLFADPSDCYGYHVCVNGTLRNGRCPIGLAYNTLKGKCDDTVRPGCPLQDVEPEVVATARPAVDLTNICGSDRNPIRDRMVSDRRTCRGYYVCRSLPDGADKQPRWEQCGAQRVFDGATGTCRDRMLVRCAFDRCDGMGSTYVSLNGDGCRGFAYCQDGEMISVDQCPESYYFDELTQSCTLDLVRHGACMA